MERILDGDLASEVAGVINEHDDSIELLQTGKMDVGEEVTEEQLPPPS